MPDLIASSEYQRALAADRHLAAIEAMVDTQTLFLRPGDRFCAGCYWEHVLKPLVSCFVGWGRGARHLDAPDPDPQAKATWRPVALAELMALDTDGKAPPAPGTDTEQWLRTSAAFDAVTRELLARLEQADPGAGHGFARNDEP
jgi:hypothetical protein